MDHAPDLSPYIPGNVSVIDFVPTVGDGYQSMAAPLTENYTTPVTGEDVFGAFIGKDTAGTSHLFVGSQLKLKVADQLGGWTDVTGAGYTTANSWTFTQYLDRTIAANGVNILQSSTSGGAFANLNASAPTAKIVFTHANAIVAACTAASPCGWFRSDTGDPTNWTATASNDVDSGTLTKGSGPITAGREWNDLALLWKGDQMFRGIYVGTLDEKIRWDAVGAGIGCVGPNAHIATEVGVIFVSNRDILLYDGSLPRSIADKVRKTWLASFGVGITTTNRARICISHNEAERNIYIWYPVQSGSVGPNRAQVYNYRSGKWGFVSVVSGGGATYSYVSCPVVGANYLDYTGSTGGGTNIANEANVVFCKPSGSGAKLVNFAASAGATRTSTPSITMGYLGDARKDQTLTRVRVVTDLSAAAPASGGGKVFDTPNDTGGGRTMVGSHNGTGDINFNVRGRIFQPSVTWPATTGTWQVLDLVPDFENSGGGR